MTIDTAGLIQVTDLSFTRLVLEASAERPVAVLFCAVWCGSSILMIPKVRVLAGEFTRQIDLALMDVEQNPRTAIELLGIDDIPHLLLFKNGRQVDPGLEGNLLVEKIRSWLNSHL